VTSSNEVDNARQVIEATQCFPHQGHDGIPGAPEGIFCLRCESDRRIAWLVSLAREARDSASRVSETTEARQEGK
jgi:hypothetical protein